MFIEVHFEQKKNPSKIAFKIKEQIKKIFGAKGIFPFDKIKYVEISMKHIFGYEIN